MLARPAVPMERFSLVAGGPFNRLLSKLGLTDADQLPSRVSIVALVLLAWLPPALLAAAQSLLDGHYSGWAYFSDWTVHTRFLIAIGVMLATERYADHRLCALVHHFRGAQIFRNEGLASFQNAVEIADRRSSSAWAEAIILAMAVIWSYFSVPLVVELGGTSWAGALHADRAVLSWAGEATRFLSNPLFLFLVLRWLWWFMVWTLLLYRIARLPLQLAPLHSDRAGGLGFLTVYPGIYSGLAFALSCVIASAMLKELAIEHPGTEMVWTAIGVWLAFNLALFIGPLLVFAYPLYARREQALIEYGRLANQHHVAFHQKWIVEMRHGENVVGASDLSTMTGINACVEAVKAMRFIPVDRVALLQLLAARASRCWR